MSSLAEWVDAELVQGERRELYVRFVESVAADDVVLMRFQDPSTRYAVVARKPATAGEATAGDPATGNAVHDERGELRVVVLPASPTARSPLPGAVPDGSEPQAAPVRVEARGIKVAWWPGHATLECDPAETEPLLRAVIEFAYYDGELRRIEAEIGAAWAELEDDKHLAFEVRVADLKQSDLVGARISRYLQRRIRYARIAPHLYETEQRLSVGSMKVSEALREGARAEARLDAVEMHLEVFGGVYEMASQRLGEFRPAHDGHILEIVIVALLAAETLLMLAGVVWHRMV